MSEIETFKQLLDTMPQGEITVPTNTIGRIFRHEYAENFISHWLAFLIDPECIGTYEPLNRLLLLSHGVDIDFSSESEIEVNREYTFTDRRRIDFYIKTDSRIIAIENKIRSGFQPDQLKDYAERIREYNDGDKREVFLIVLCPKNNNIYRDYENGSDDLFDFNLICYEDLVEEFKSIRINPIDNARASFLMTDFITHMEEYIMKKDTDKSLDLEMLKFGVDNSEKLNNLSEKLKASKTQFAQFLREKVISLNKGNSDWETNTSTTYIQLFKKSWGELQVHFELKPKGSFPFKSYEVVLHTKENTKKHKTQELKALQEEAEKLIVSSYNKKEFVIDYESEETINESVDKMIDALQYLMSELTEIVDQEVAKSLVLNR